MKFVTKNWFDTIRPCTTSLQSVGLDADLFSPRHDRLWLPASTSNAWTIARGRRLRGRVGVVVCHDLFPTYCSLFVDAVFFASSLMQLDLAVCVENALVIFLLGDFRQESSGSCTVSAFLVSVELCFEDE